MIISICGASLSDNGSLLRKQSLATVLYEEAKRNKKLRKASQEPGCFGGFVLKQVSIRFRTRVNLHREPPLADLPKRLSFRGLCRKLGRSCWSCSPTQELMTLPLRSYAPPPSPPNTFRHDHPLSALHPTLFGFAGLHVSTKFV